MIAAVVAWAQLHAAAIAAFTAIATAVYSGEQVISGALDVKERVEREAKSADRPAAPQTDRSPTPS